jgi:pre-mRNA-processing factor 39
MSQIANFENRPTSTSSAAKAAGAAKENGIGGGELDEVSKRKAEARLLTFYEAHAEPSTAAHGTADFN